MGNERKNGRTVVHAHQKLHQKAFYECDRAVCVGKLRQDCLSANFAGVCLTPHKTACMRSHRCDGLAESPRSMELRDRIWTAVIKVILVSAADVTHWLCVYLL